MNNHKIAEDSPFNVAHVIKSGTLLTGYEISDDKLANGKKTEILPAGYSALFRPRCWWSNSIKCTGSIKLIPCEYPEAIIDNILKTVSRFDYVETNMGFFKYQQNQMHKSNIYSIKLTNTGLNPNTRY